MKKKPPLAVYPLLILLHVIMIFGMGYGLVINVYPTLADPETTALHGMGISVFGMYLVYAIHWSYASIGTYRKEMFALDQTPAPSSK